MVRTRLILGILLIVGFLLLACLDCFLAGGPIFHVFVGILIVLGLIEFCRLAERRGLEPLTIPAVALVVGLVAMDYALRVTDGELFGGRLGFDPKTLAGFYAPMGIAATGSLMLLATAHLLVRDPSHWLADVPVTALGLFYVWFLGAHILAIRGLGNTDRVGMAYILVFLSAAKLGDSGAYFVGIRWGRHALAPQTSPRKTIEGALGGLVTSTLVTVLLAGILGLDGRLSFWATFGLVVGAAGQLGDLVESALKRSAGAKDSSQLFPSFGGILDVVDSLLLSAPLAFWLLAW